MGYWFAEFFRERGFSVCAYDVKRDRTLSASQRLGIEACSSLEEIVAKSSIVLLSTPMRETPKVLRNLGGILEGSEHSVEMVFDIASFKESIVGHYHHLPAGVKVASTHPLFGPRARRVSKHSVIVVPVPEREGDATAVAGFLERLGFKTLIMDAKRHDTLMSVTIGGSYAISMLLAKLLAEASPDFKHEALNATFKYYLVYILSILGENEKFLTEVFEEDGVRRVLTAIAREITNMHLMPHATLEKIRLKEIRRRMLESFENLPEPASIIYAIVESVFE